MRCIRTRSGSGKNRFRQSCRKFSMARGTGSGRIRLSLSRSFTARSGSRRSNSTGLKKNLDLSVEEKRRLIDPANVGLAVVRQCELIGLARSSNYYEPLGESEYNGKLMRLIDAIYTKHPFLGSPKITDLLRKDGHEVNHKRIERLMRVLGLEAVY